MPSEAGASARAEFRRARRAFRWRRPLSRVAALSAVGVGLIAVAGGGWALAVVAGLGVLAAWRLRPNPDPGRWRRGAAGEVATARLLASLPARFVVLHDRRVPASSANIDHLVIGPTGVWVVDSKAFRAPLRVRRGAVWAGDHEVGTASAAWQAERVAQVLGAAVEAVVAVHGQGLRRRGKVVGGVVVVPAHRLCRRLRVLRGRGARRGRQRLSRAEIRALAGAAAVRLPAARRSRVAGEA